MKNQLMFLVFALCTIFSARADGAIGKFIWPEYNKVELPDSLKSEAAFFLQNITTTDIKDSYLNSDEAAEEYSLKEFYVGDNGRIGMLNARTIKSNGEIVNLDGGQIITTYAETKTKYGSYGTRKVQLTYPNVEVGDVIDFAYRIDIDYYILSDLFVLESYIPSIYSRITIRNMSPFDITAYSLHDMPEMVSKKTAGIETISWQKSGVGVRKYGSVNALAPTAPHCVYVLWRRGESLTYDPIYKNNVLDYPNNFGPNNYITDRLIDEGVIKKEESKMIQLKKAIDHFSKEFSWDSEAASNLPSSSVKAFKDQIIDGTHYIRFVIKFMSENDIKFERCFTKSLLDGKFEHGYISHEQLDYFFLIASDENGAIHFIFPPRGRDKFYYFDEIPYYVEGNQSIALFGEKDFLDSQSSIAIPAGNEKSNTHFANLLMEVSYNDSIISKTKRKDVFKGHFSYLTRSRNGNDWLNEYNVLHDTTELEPSREDAFYPYEIEFVQEGLTRSFFKEIDDSLFWFESEDLLPKGVYEENETDDELGDYLVLPFLKTNSISVFVKSEKSIQLAEDMNELSFENEIGQVNTKILQLNDNMLKLTYSIIVKKRFVDGEVEVEQFKELLEKNKDIRSKKWVVSISK